MSVDAIVLVGGQGTRLRPLTLTTPKPMLPVAGVPFLAHLLVRARAAGVDHVVLATSYRPDVFASYFGDGSALGLELDYVTEVEPLGTGGGVRNVAGRVRGDDVLVLNGDILSGTDFRALVATHRATGADVTLDLTRVEDPRAFGLVPTDDNGRVIAFLEKPQSQAEVVTDQVNAGCYVFSRRALDRIPAGRGSSLEREVFPALVDDGATVMGHLDPAYWLDLGTPAAFITGSCDLVLGRIASAAVPGPVGEALVLPGAQVAPDAQLGGGATVGAGACIGSGATVSAAVVFDGAKVAAGASVRRSVLGRGVTVDEGAVLEDAVIGDGARIGAGNELRAGVRVWPGTDLAAGAVRFSP